MGCGCFGSVAKLILFVFNFLFLLIGIGIVTLGAIILRDLTYNASDSDSTTAEAIQVVLEVFRPIPIVLIVIGSIVLIISFFGCCGAVRDSICMLNVYAVILFMILVGQIAIAIYCLVNWNSPDKSLEKPLYEIFNLNNGDSKKFFDEIQKEFRCCGVVGAKDYMNAGWPTPPSCYSPMTERGVLNRTGCAAAFVRWTNDVGQIIGWVGIVFAAIEISGVVLSCIQSRSIVSKSKRNYS